MRLELRALFEGLVELVVHAIDEKSPYTGQHCRRVPILTELIADAACATQQGALKETFLREKVYLRYAVEYLDPEQIDDEFLDEATALGFAPPAERVQ